MGLSLANRISGTVLASIWAVAVEIVLQALLILIAICLWTLSDMFRYSAISIDLHQIETAYSSIELTVAFRTLLLIDAGPPVFDISLERFLEIVPAFFAVA